MLDLKNKYKKEVKSKLQEQFNYKNIMEIPEVLKVSINRGLGESINNSKVIESSFDQLIKITGQKPVFTKAKKSISNFKLREGQIVGIKVTLRNKKMYDFIQKLVNVALPKIKDFRGISGRSFDGQGNYTLGIKEDSIFPEISYETSDKLRGFDVTINTSAKSDEEAKALLSYLGFPFKN